MHSPVQIPLPLISWAFQMAAWRSFLTCFYLFISFFPLLSSNTALGTSQIAALYSFFVVDRSIIPACSCSSLIVSMPMHPTRPAWRPSYTKEEKPGSGARDLAMLFMTICVPFRLTTALEASCNEFIFWLRVFLSPNTICCPGRTKAANRGKEEKTPYKSHTHLVTLGEARVATRILRHIPLRQRVLRLSLLLMVLLVLKRTRNLIIWALGWVKLHARPLFIKSPNP